MSDGPADSGTAFTQPEITTPRGAVTHHWLRGVLWGLSLGIGLAIYAVLFRVITLQVSTMLLIVLLGVVIGVLWARFGPVKR